MTETTIAGRYRILEKLGAGAMGVVHRVFDRLTQKTVALKQVEMPTSSLQFGTRGLYQKERHALTHEFRTLAGLRHPNIVSVLDYGFDDSTPFFTMELIENAQTLTSYGKNLDYEEKIRLLIEVLQALSYLHRHHIIHRDLKPDNILVTAEGSVKVMDFGLAADHSMAADKKLAGTVTYMAPERLRGQIASIESDLFAVGIIGYELFVGKYPFSRAGFSILAADIMSTTPDTSALEGRLGTVLDRLLAKDPEDRYHSAQTVIKALCDATTRTLPAESQSIRESFLQAAPFIGREAELQQLERALHDTLDGRGSAYLIGGESGVGKSRLLDELAVHAMVEGALVVRGQGVEGGGLPYQLWRDVLPRLLLNIELTELEASILKDLVPNIGNLLGRNVNNAPELKGTNYLQRLMFIIVDVLRQQAQTVVLLLEDLQWTVESVVILNHLLNFVQDNSWFIVGSYRDDETPDLHEQLANTQHINLKRLNDEHIAEMSRAMLGEAGTQAPMLELLKRETEGNAFFMVEVVRALAEEAGRLANIGTMTLPDNVFAGGMMAVLKRRLDQIPQSHHHILRYAAVIGRRINEILLNQLLPNTDIKSWLYLAEGAAVLHIRANDWQFAHDKLREAVLQVLSKDEKSQLHGKVAEAIEIVYPDNTNYHEVLLEHWHLAENLDKEIHYLQPVAENLLRTNSDYEAINLRLRRALEQLPEDSSQTIPLLNLLSESTSSQRLEGGEHSEAMKIAQAALKLAQDIGDKHGMSMSLFNLAAVARYQGKYEQAVDYYQQSFTILEQLGDAKRGECLIALSIIASYHGEYDRAIDYQQQSLTFYREVDDRVRIAEALNNLGNIMEMQGAYEQGVDYHRQSLAIRQTLGNRVLIATSFQNLGVVFTGQGKYEQAFDYLQQSRAIFREYDDGRGIYACHESLGKLFMKQGKYEQALIYFQQNVVMLQSSGDSLLTGRTYFYPGWVKLKQHDPQAYVLFYEGLKYAAGLQQIPRLMLILLCGFAGVFMLNQQPMRAGELIGLIKNHPAKDALTLINIDELLAELSEMFPLDNLTDAIERGKSLDLEIVVQEILDEFGEEERP